MAVTATQLTIVRTAATALLTGLAAVAVQYPHLAWIPIVYAVLGTLGIHAIPSIGQIAPMEDLPSIPVPSQSLSTYPDVPPGAETPKEQERT